MKGFAVIQQHDMQQMLSTDKCFIIPSFYPSLPLFSCLMQTSKELHSMDLCVAVLRLWTKVCSGNGKQYFFFFFYHFPFQLFIWQTLLSKSTEYKCSTELQRKQIRIFTTICPRCKQRDLKTGIKSERSVGLSQTTNYTSHDLSQLKQTIFFVFFIYIFALSFHSVQYQFLPSLCSAIGRSAQLLFFFFNICDLQAIQNQ